MAKPRISPALRRLLAWAAVLAAVAAIVLLVRMNNATAP
jgi:hypothetical protein